MRENRGRFIPDGDMVRVIPEAFVNTSTRRASFLALEASSIEIHVISTSP
jgi:hypothetical protein